MKGLSKLNLDKIIIVYLVNTYTHYRHGYFVSLFLVYSRISFFKNLNSLSG